MYAKDYARAERDGLEKTTSPLGTAIGVATREPEVIRRIQNLDHAAGNADEAMQVLLGRLGAVSRPEPPQADATKAPEEVTSTDMGNVLMGIERRLIRLRRAIEDATDRLEI